METAPKSTKSPSRVLIKKEKDKWQVLLEINAVPMRTLKGGRVVMIASCDLVASNILWVGNQWVKPKVICRVFAKFSPAQLTKVRRAAREQFVRNNPIIFTEL